MRIRDEAGGFSRKRSPIQNKKTELHYARQLRKVARHVGDIIHGFAPDGDLSPSAETLLQRALDRYADALGPWADAVGSRMLADVDRSDATQWFSNSERIGRALKREVDTGPVGALMRQRLSDQVSLIKSLPTEAAQRVHELALKGLVEGRRSSEIAAEIMRSGEVTQSRANTIARTEVARTASTLIQVRAQSVGSTQWIWRTSRDAQVRPSHKALNGEVFSWDRPPTVDGMVGVAGCFPNCRCRPEPIFPD